MSIRNPRLRVFSSVFQVLVLLAAESANAFSRDDSKTIFVSLRDASNVTMKANIDGVSFNIPLNYFYRGYYKPAHGWQNITKDEIDGKIREKIDFINLTAIVPDLEPITENNYLDFEVLGNGKKVAFSITHFRPWNYYFDHYFKTLEPRPESAEVPGMLHFYSVKQGRDDRYFSDDHATLNLTVITCPDETVRSHVSPACFIETSYRPRADLIKKFQIEGAIFRVEYQLSTVYLKQWRQIDKKLKLLIDTFVESVATTNKVRGEEKPILVR